MAKCMVHDMHIASYTTLYCIAYYTNLTYKENKVSDPKYLEKLQNIQNA